MVGNSEDVRAVAVRVRHEADRVHEVAISVGATRDIGWRSVAATRFREVVTDRLVGLGRGVGRLDGAAEAVEAHARALDRAHEALRGLLGDGSAGGPR